MKIDFAKDAAPKFQPNAFYDRLISMRRTDRKTFDSFSTATHISLTTYEAAKREHESLKSEK
jgi:hypothetical protein